MTSAEASCTGHPPDIVGVLSVDAKAMADCADQGEEILSRLPPRPGRSAEQQATADAVHRSSRWLRHRFMDAHAGTVYDTLTEGLSRPLRLAELASAAAEEFRGLVPGRELMAAESARLQADKEGWEVDQAVFFQGVLRQATAGLHLMRSMLRPTPRALELLPEFQQTGRLDLGAVRVVRDGPAARLTIHNEHCLNAEDNRLTADLETAVDLALLDDQVHVGVLRGSVMTHPRYTGRRVFSAGINLKHLHEGRISFIDFLLGRELGFIHKLVRGLSMDDTPLTWPRRTVEKPWLAGVDTFAIGGGMQLLFTVDKVVAGADAFFSLPAAQEGIVPGVGNLRLGRLAGGRLARRVILGGRRIWASEPVAELICDEVTEPDQVGAALDRGITQLDNAAVVANRKMINVAEEPIDALRAYLAEFSLTQGLRLYSQDVITKVGRFSAATSGVPAKGDP